MDRNSCTEALGLRLNMMFKPFNYLHPEFVFLSSKMCSLSPRPCLVSKSWQTPIGCLLPKERTAANLSWHFVQRKEVVSGVLHRSLTNNVSINFYIKVYEKSIFQIMYKLSRIMSNFSHFLSAVANRTCSACSPTSSSVVVDEDPQSHEGLLPKSLDWDENLKP